MPQFNIHVDDTHRSKATKYQNVVTYLAAGNQNIDTLLTRVTPSTIPRFLRRAHKVASLDGFYDTCDGGDKWSWERAWHANLLKGAPKCSYIDSTLYRGVFLKALALMEACWRAAGQ